MIRRFPSISPIKLTGSIFNCVPLHRNNAFYGFILNVCQIIYDNTLPAEQLGLLTFVDFTRDEKKMATLFEAFVRNFYRREQTTYSVASHRITWQFTGDDLLHLPMMLTDIYLKSQERHMIIDTKFYSKTLSSSYYGKENIQSQHLYQLFRYLLNQRREENPKTFSTVGILLYQPYAANMILTFYIKIIP